MRVLTGLLLLGTAFAAVPSAAQADTTLCNFSSGGDTSYQQRLGPFLSGVTSTAAPGGSPTVSGGQAMAAAQSVLGAQLVMLWADTPRQGWSVAFSPGAHDAATARAAIESALATSVSAADKDYLMGALTLLPTPYSKAELDAVVSALGPAVLDLNGIYSGVGIGCEGTDVHVDLNVIPLETPEVRAQVDALIAPYGDKVRPRFGIGRPSPADGTVPARPPVAEKQAKPARVRDLVSLPATARCVRGGTLKIKPGKQVAKLRLKAGKRSASAANGKTARLELKSRRTKVAVTVTLKDGGTATQTFTYRRCG